MRSSPAPAATGVIELRLQNLAPQPWIETRSKVSVTVFKALTASYSPARLTS
jgi:hypothetical protein